MDAPSFLSQVEEDVHQRAHEGKDAKFILSYFTRADGGIEAAMLDLSPEEIWAYAGKRMADGCRGFCFGFDRYAKEGQGTTLSDVYTVFAWSEENPVWTLGIVEYSPTERKALPLEEYNPFWLRAQSAEVVYMIRKHRGLARTLQGRIGRRAAGGLASLRLFLGLKPDVPGLYLCELQQTMMERHPEDNLTDIAAGLATCRGEKMTWQAVKDAMDEIFLRFTEEKGKEMAIEFPDINPEDFFGPVETPE